MNLGWGAVMPSHHVVSVERTGRSGALAASRIRNRRQADDVAAATIHERGNRSGTDHVDARAEQRKSLLLEIDHARSLRDATIEPRLDRVPLAGLDIGRTRG